MSSRDIEIIVSIRDATGGKVKDLANQLLKIDSAAQRVSNRLKSFANQKYSATLALIDRITSPASRINSLLKKIAGGVYSATIKINDGALSGIRKIESSLARLANRSYSIAVNLRGSAMNKLGGLASGAAMGAGVFAPVAGMAGVGFGVANAIQAYAGFEKQMSRVQAIQLLDKNSAEMQALTAQAKELGKTTAFTRQQVGEAQYYQSLAGWSTESILKSTPHLLNMALASDLDLGRTSDIITDELTAFGLKATDTYIDKQGRRVNAVEQYADLMTKLQASSNTDVSQAHEAIKYSANLFGVMSANLTGQEKVQKAMDVATDAAVMTGLLANAGIKESMAGTGMSNIMQRMASGNRNTFWGLGFTDTQIEDLQHNLLMPTDIFKQLNKAYHEGIDPNKIIDFVEEMSGEKIHADTRRKLNKLASDTLENGGKLGTSDMMQLATMLAGAEHAHKLLAIIMGDWDEMAAKLNNVHGTAQQMASTMGDNLAGSFVRLGSAWDNFQQNLMEGGAGQGLRNFIDALTEMINRADDLFKDGVDIMDVGKIFFDAISRLKNKFMELDGLGSLLAGGALFAGLNKIIGMFRGLKASAQGGSISGQKIGAMNITAGVVNVNGRVNGVGVGGGSSRGGGQLNPILAAQQAQARATSAWNKVRDATTVGLSAAQIKRLTQQAQMADLEARRFVNLARVEEYNARRAQILANQNAPSTTGWFSNIKSAAGTSAAFAGVFGLMDIFATRTAGQERLAAAPPEMQAQIIKENRQAEWQASSGALGAVVGAAVLGGIGSIAGPMGTMIGGMIGASIGEYLGIKAGAAGAENESARTTNTENLNRAIDEALSHKPKKTFFEQTPTEPSYDFDHFDIKKIKPKHIDYDFTPDITTATQAAIQETELARYQREQLEGFTAKYLSQFGSSGVADVYRANGNYNLEDLFFNRASAAELNEEQLAQQAAMENGTFDFSAQTESLSAYQEQIAAFSEYFNEFTAQMSENLTTAFEGVGEFFSDFGSQISESLTSTFDGVGEMFSTFGTQITENLSSSLEGVTQAFTSTKETICAAWNELPAFFSGIFSGLGGAAEAAGSAIYAGLTSMCGAVISAWQAVASTVSSIISSISAAASSFSLPSFGGSIPHHAEGGFINNPEIALIGEAGRELILPLNDEQRSLDLLRQSGLVSEDSGGATVLNSGGSGEINLNVNFTINSNNPQDVMNTIKENLANLTEDIAARLSAQIHTAFNNRPLTV